MTTERTVLHRYQPVDWPTLVALNLPDDVGLLSVENRRLVWEDMPVAVHAASELLRDAIALSGVAEGLSLWLVAVSRPQPVPDTPLRRAFFARRPGFWTGLETAERQPVVLPDGDRTEVRTDWGEETVGFAATIRFGLDALPVALEVVRRLIADQAVVVASEVADADPLSSLLPPSPLPHKVGGVAPLFARAVAGVADRTFPFVARAYGMFDDVDVGPDLIARTPLLDRAEAALRSVLDGERRHDH